EVEVIVHPDQSEQVPEVVERYQSIITPEGGKIARQEDWDRRQLAYPTQKLVKAHYVCLNIEIGQSTLDDLQYAFLYNDAILRYLIAKTDGAPEGASIMMKSVEREEGRRGSADGAATTDDSNADEDSAEEDADEETSES